MIHDAHGIGLGHLIIIRTDRLYLNHLQLLGGVAIVAKDERAVLRHSLLTDTHTLTALNDEIAAHVLGALSHTSRIHMGLVLQETILRADHHRNLSEMDVGEQPLPHGLLPAVRVINLHVGDADIHEERCGVGQVTEPGVVGHHRQNGAVVLKDGGLLELGIVELQMDLVFTVDGAERNGHRLLPLSHQGIGGGCAQTRGGCERRARTAQRNLWTSSHNHWIHHRDNFWNVDIHEMIKTLKLMAHNLLSIGLAEIQLKNALPQLCAWSGIIGHLGHAILSYLALNF